MQKTQLRKYMPRGPPCSLSQGNFKQENAFGPVSAARARGIVAGRAKKPVAWTHRAVPGGGRVFYTSLGHPEDFGQKAFRQLLSNAAEWGLKKSAD
jgi:hypothetical protein